MNRIFLILILGMFFYSEGYSKSMSFAEHLKKKGRANRNSLSGSVISRRTFLSPRQSGPFRANLPDEIRQSALQGRFKATLSSRFKDVFTPRPIQRSRQAGITSLWGGIDPQQILNAQRSLSPQQFVSSLGQGSGSTGQIQPNFDFAKAISELQGGNEENPFFSNILKNANNPIEVPENPSSESPNSSGPGGAGGPNGGGGSPNAHSPNDDLQDRLNDLARQRELDDLRDRLDDLRNGGDDGGSGDGGGGGGDFGPEIIPGPDGQVPERSTPDFSGAPPGHIDPNQIPEGGSRGPVRGLVAAGAGGSPGLQYQVPLSGGALAGCAGTVVAVKRNARQETSSRDGGEGDASPSPRASGQGESPAGGGPTGSPDATATPQASGSPSPSPPVDDAMCVIATAGHCLEESIYLSGNAQYDSQLGGYTAQVELKTADFGTVQAQAFVNEDYANGKKWKDSGALVFRCPSNTQVPVVPLARRAGRPGERVKYGKVMNGGEGFYEGQTFSRNNTYVNGYPLARAELGVNQFGTVIEQGDSGGPLTRVDANGKPTELIGVLSSKTPGTAESHYAAMDSLDFIRRVQERFAPQGSERLAFSTNASRLYALGYSHLSCF